ncbi:hypothetical protein [Streptomyces noursei]
MRGVFLVLGYLSAWRCLPALVASWWRCWPRALRLLTVLAPVVWGTADAMVSAGAPKSLASLAALGAALLVSLVVEDSDEARWRLTAPVARGTE